MSEYIHVYALEASGDPKKIQPSKKNKNKKMPASENLILVHPSTQMLHFRPEVVEIQQNSMVGMKKVLDGLTNPTSSNHDSQTLLRDLGRSYVEVEGRMKLDNYGKPKIIPAKVPSQDGGEYQELCRRFFGQVDKNGGPSIPQVNGIHQGIFADAMATASYNFSLSGKQMKCVTCRMDESGAPLETPVKRQLAEADIQGGIDFVSLPTMKLSRKAEVYSMTANSPVYSLVVVDPQNPRESQLLFKKKTGEWEMVPQTAAFMQNREILAKRNSSNERNEEGVKVAGNVGPIDAFVEANNYQPIFNISFKATLDATGVTDTNKVTQANFKIEIESRTPELHYTGPRAPELYKMGIEATGIPISLKDKATILAYKTAEAGEHLERTLGAVPNLPEDRSKSNLTSYRGIQATTNLSMKAPSNKPEEIKIEQDKVNSAKNDSVHAHVKKPGKGVKK